MVGYSARMILETRAVPPFFKNGFVVGCEETREGIVIDPGDEVEELLEAVEQHRLSIKYILLTHAHLDHITGVGTAKAALGAPVGLHRDDNFLYERIVQQGIAFGFQAEKQPDVDFFYEGEGPLRFGRYEVRILHTPGHCPGGVCLAVRRDNEAGSTLFVGDTLFAGSIGRTDLPGGDLDVLLKSIRNVLFAFPDETVVHSGHGEPTTIGRERRGNPFLNG
jgi:glyoxylase-like metal-dependent hydrolase (beta-lactamase superfamily II)